MSNMRDTVAVSQAEAADVAEENLDLEREVQIDEDDDLKRAIIDQRKAELLLDLRKEETSGNQISDDLYDRFRVFSESYSFDTIDMPFWATFNHRMKAARRNNLIPKDLEDTSVGERYIANFKAFVGLALEALSDVVLSAVLLKQKYELFTLLALLTGLLSIPLIVYGFFSVTHGFSKFAMFTFAPVLVAALLTDLSDGLYLLAAQGGPLTAGDYLAFALPVLVPVTEMVATCAFPKMYNTCSQALLIQFFISPIVAALYGLLFLGDHFLGHDPERTPRFQRSLTGIVLIDFVLIGLSGICFIIPVASGCVGVDKISNPKQASDPHTQGWADNIFTLMSYFIVPGLPVIYGGNLRGIIFLGILLGRTIAAYLFIKLHLKTTVISTP